MTLPPLPSVRASALICAPKLTKVAPALWMTAFAPRKSPPMSTVPPPASPLASTSPLPTRPTWSPSSSIVPPLVPEASPRASITPELMTVAGAEALRPPSTVIRPPDPSAFFADGSGGRITVDGGRNASAPATVISSGVIEARGEASGTKGGTIELLGDHVGLVGSGLVDASGDAGGGTVLIGGDFRGANAVIQSAGATFVSFGAQIKADALTLGKGGKVIVWSDGPTRSYGSISARGGALGGNGGFIETSGKGYLDVVGARIDASARSGSQGQWL